MTQSIVNREVIYAKSMYMIMRRINFKAERGWKVIGEIKETADGRYSCLIEREIRFNWRAR